MNKARPVGVTVLCILVAISLGAIPIWFAYLFFTNQELSRLTGMNLAAFLGNFTISMGIVASAFFTWKGSNRAKRILFSLAWLHVAGVIYNNINLLVNPSLIGLDTLNEKQITKLLTNIGRSVLWLVLLHWYFNTQKAKAFFAKENEPQSLPIAT